MGAIGRELIKMTQQPLIHYIALFENSPPKAGKSPEKRNSGTNARIHGHVPQFLTQHFHQLRMGSKKAETRPFSTRPMTHLNATQWAQQGTDLRIWGP
ncbi:hypothetical protein YC2023_050634 [Brassica napus]